MSSDAPAGRTPHQHRQVAESFGRHAARYDRARPRYPDALVERIIAAGPGPEGPDVLDVGCGTGIAARQFQAAGCRVPGVEPDARMAELARQFGVDVEEATCEAWDPAGRTFDVVAAGTAWHWVDPVAGAAKAARVLRHGGLLAPFWNVFQLPPDLARAIAEICHRVLPELPADFQDMLVRGVDRHQEVLTRTAAGIRDVRGFSEPEQWRHDWECTYPRDAWLDQLPTFGYFTRLPPQRLAQVLEGTGAAIDAMGGGFTASYATMAITAARTHPA